MNQNAVAIGTPAAAAAAAIPPTSHLQVRCTEVYCRHHSPQSRLEADGVKSLDLSSTLFFFFFFKSLLFLLHGWTVIRGGASPTRRGGNGVFASFL